MFVDVNAGIFNVEKLKKACEVGHGNSCYNLADVIFKQDDSKAFKYYKKACELNNAKACFNIANAYKYGRNIKVGDTIYFQNGCDKGDKQKCEFIQIIKNLQIEKQKQIKLKKQKDKKNEIRRQSRIEKKRQREVKRKNESKRLAKFKPLSYPMTKYIISNKTVIDKRTGLMWMRCAMGQELVNQTCIGSAKKYRLSFATELTVNFANFTDWRLPNIKELNTLVYCSNMYTIKYKMNGYDSQYYGAGCFSGGGNYQKPTINKNAFPNIPATSFWSSSGPLIWPASGTSISSNIWSSNAWAVSFNHGNDNLSFKHFGKMVLLVRNIDLKQFDNAELKIINNNRVELSDKKASCDNNNDNSCFNFGIPVKKIDTAKTGNEVCNHLQAICKTLDDIRYCALPNQSYTKCGQKILNQKQQSKNRYNEIQRALKKAGEKEYAKCMAVGEIWLSSKGVGASGESGIATVLAITGYQGLILNCQKSPYKRRQAMQKELGIDLE